MAVPLTAKAGLNTTEFSKGVQEIRNRLNQLNTSLAENRQELKNATKEADSLRKAQQELASAMKNGGTEEQKREMQELSDKLAQVNSRIGTLKTTESELRSAVRGANKELDEQYNTTKKNSDAMNSFATAIKAVIASAAAKTLSEWLFGSNAEMEQYITSFTVMLGDAEKAQKLMSDLTDFAAVTPFELTGVVKSSEMLLNYGVAAEDVVKKMTQLGNLAGGNATKLDRVTLAYGQMLAKGKVSGEEMRQMLEAGVPILQALADTMGITTAEVQALASKGKVGISELDAAIVSLTSNGGQFAGMMEKQSETMLGMASTAKNMVAQIGRDIGDKAFEKLKDTFSELLEKVNELEENGKLAKWTEEAGEALAKLTEGFIDLTGFVLENKEAVVALAAAYGTMKGISAVVNVGTDIEKTLSSIVDLGSKANTAIKGMGTSLGAVSLKAGIAGAAIFSIGQSISYISSLFTLDEDVQMLTERTEELKGSVDEAVASFETEASTLRAQAEAYEELRVKADRTAAEEERLKELADELQTSLGGNVEVVNSLTGEYNNLTVSVEEYIKKQSESVRLEAMKDAAVEAYKTIDDIEKQMQTRMEEHANFDSIWEHEIQGESWQFINDMAALREAKEAAEAIIAEYEAAIGESFDGVEDDSAEMADTVGTNSTNSAKSLEEIEQAAEECRKATNELANSAKTLSNAFAEQEENGGLSTDTILSLVDAGYAAALAVDAETGAVKLDAEAYRELAKAKLEAQKVDLLTSKAEIEADFLKASNQAAGSGDYKLIERIRQEKEKATAEIDAQLMALGTIDFDKVISGDYGVSKSTKKTTDTDPYEQAKKDLKYRYDMGEFESDADYYEEMYALMREHGIAEDSDEWRSVDVAKKKYEDKLREDESKANEKAAQEAEKLAKQEYSDITKAFKEASDERIKQIDKELDAKKKAADEAIAAIDAEIEARRRAKEDDDIQSEIDAVNAQLKYAQLDDFSRAQLERKRQQLYDQQADIAWERSTEDRKSAINSQLSADEEAAEKQKESLSEAADAVETALDRAADGIALTAQQIEAAASALQQFFGNLSDGSASSSPVITNNITTNGGATTNNNTFAIGTENYTAEQLVHIIFEVLGNPTL